ncbi:50S ribosomal protein L37ae [Candidatus Woesearchaeota archaeon]|nr:50S ribosomal protein L37ae [Candidatus Woesearchaeota archaeon]
MAEENVSAKRFGVRYGRKLRDKVGKIDRERRSNVCPYCHFRQIGRVAAGIWHCNKCGAKFTGRAYSIGSKIVEVEA